jgi:broad specificity phosphatase PhoE
MCNIVTIASFPHMVSADNRDHLRTRYQDILPEYAEAWRTRVQPVKRIMRGLALGYEAIYCPTTNPHLSTAVLFAETVGLPAPIPDSRINNVDYGIYKGRPVAETPPASAHIDLPYEGGTSWAYVAAQWRSFMEDVVPRYRGRAILLAGQSGAGYMMLTHFCERIPLEEAVTMTRRPRWRVWCYRW